MHYRKALFLLIPMCLQLWWDILYFLFFFLFFILCELIIQNGWKLWTGANGRPGCTFLFFTLEYWKRTAKITFCKIIAKNDKQNQWPILWAVNTLLSVPEWFSAVRTRQGINNSIKKFASIYQVLISSEISLSGACFSPPFLCAISRRR